MQKWSAILVTLMVMGCNTGPDDGSTRGERGRLGKADDVTGSCGYAGGNHCGGQSDGSCWCDDLCESYGDCCEDKAEVCDPTWCGGFAGLPCPEGMECHDYPYDSCDPASSGADCSGYCLPKAECFVGGCSGQVCSAMEGVVTTCEFLPWYACFDTATCELQADSGQCGWTPTPELCACLEANGGPAPAGCDPTPAPTECFVGGCSGQICSNMEGVVSTCEWRAWYACFDTATCEAQADSGECGWTPTAELCACLEANDGPVPAACPASGPTCTGSCGGQSPDGCWCDSLCSYYGDCCPDYGDAC